MRRTFLLCVAALATVAILSVGYLAGGDRENKSRYDDANHLTFIVPTIIGYGDEHGTFPDNIYSKDGKPLLSWRVAVLPYYGPEGAEQYKQFHLDEPWDSPHNKEVARTIPENYRDPEGSRFTPYLAVAGEKAAFRPHNPRPWVKRGVPASKGILVVTAQKSDVFWTEPRDMTIEDAQKKEKLRWESPRILGMDLLGKDHRHSPCIDAFCTESAIGQTDDKSQFEFVPGIVPESVPKGSGAKP